MFNSAGWEFDLTVLKKKKNTTPPPLLRMKNWNFLLDFQHDRLQIGFQKTAPLHATFKADNLALQFDNSRSTKDLASSKNSLLADTKYWVICSFFFYLFKLNEITIKQHLLNLNIIKVFQASKALVWEWLQHSSVSEYGLCMCCGPSRPSLQEQWRTGSPVLSATTSRAPKERELGLIELIFLLMAIRTWQNGENTK